MKAGNSRRVSATLLSCLNGCDCRLVLDVGLAPRCCANGCPGACFAGIDPVANM